jgi:hypothetical protein
MNVGVDIEYIARDERRQDIPWIRAMDKTTGRVTVYQDEEKPLTEAEIKDTPRRKMDCVDCHNRPSHIFRSPDYAIDEAIMLQKIDRSLPDIKRVAVEAMAKEYDTKEAASAGIAGAIADYYRLKNAAFYSANEVQITKAIGATQEAFSKNVFPRMKVRWSGYPENIGHFINPGCMRCHDGKHKSADGITITRDCGACHSILSQGRPDSLQTSTSEGGLDFVHPVDIDNAWKETGCYECHQGAAM